MVGLGAAAYSPAKYGILTEYLPHRKLVIANGWIEGLTVASIILGTVLGGVLIHAARLGRAAALRHAADRDRDRHRRPRRRSRSSSWSTPSRRSSTSRCRAPACAIKKLPADPLDTLTDFCALRRPPVARPARPDLARRHHAVLGRRRDAAVHRHRVGARRARLRPVAAPRSCRASPRSASRSARCSPRSGSRSTARCA